jgi:hypothetical protein
MWSRFSIAGLIFMLSCSRPLPAIESVNLQKWKSDRNGCTGYRDSTRELLMQQKHKLTGLTENQILELFGKPDAAELYKRNQKFYYYQLRSDTLCNPPSDGSLKLSLRFNAIGRLKEIAVE